MKNKAIKKQIFFNDLMVFSFLLFLTILIWGIYFKINRYNAIIKNYRKLESLSALERFTYNIIPFTRFSAKDFILNTLAFAPFGLYLPLLFKNHTHLKGALTCFLFSLLIELTQYITIVGTFSTNDLIANTLGYFVGAFLYFLIVKRLSKRVINFFNMIIVTIASPLAVYAIITTALNVSVYITKIL